MSTLPVKQISESQRLTAKLQVEPDAEVMQGHFGSQTNLKAIQGMRTLTSQPKGIKQLTINGLNNLTQPCQPACATPLGVSRRNARTVQRFIQAVLCLHLIHQMPTEGHDDITLLPLQPIELLALGQGRKCRAQVAHHIAVESAFAGKLCPLSKHSQGHHLATGQRRRWSRAMFLSKALRLAKIIDHHVQCSQKGITIHQSKLLFLVNGIDKLTVGYGCLSFKSFLFHTKRLRNPKKYLNKK